MAVSLADGLLPEHVPWLARAGVGQFHVDVQVRPGATYRSFVDAWHVRAWRLLLASCYEQALRVADELGAQTQAEVARMRAEVARAGAPPKKSSGKGA